MNISRHHNKLPAETIARIRRLFAEGVERRAIAERLGLSRAVVAKVIAKQEIESLDPYPAF